MKQKSVDPGDRCWPQDQPNTGQNIITTSQLSKPSSLAEDGLQETAQEISGTTWHPFTTLDWTKKRRKKHKKTWTFDKWHGKSPCFLVNTIKVVFCWWLNQPIWKNISPIGSFPQIGWNRGENKKYLKPLCPTLSGPQHASGTRMIETTT